MFKTWLAGKLFMFTGDELEGLVCCVVVVDVGLKMRVERYESEVELLVFTGDILETLVCCVVMNDVELVIWVEEIDVDVVDAEINVEDDVLVLVNGIE